MDLGLALALKTMPLKIALALALAVVPASSQASTLALGNCASLLAWFVCNLWRELDVDVLSCVDSKCMHVVLSERIFFQIFIPM